MVLAKKARFIADSLIVGKCDPRYSFVTNFQAHPPMYLNGFDQLN